MWEKDSSTKEYKSIAFCCERLPTFHQVICPWKVSLGRCPVLSTRDVPSGLQRPCQTEHVQPTGKNQVPFALGKTKLLRKKKKTPKTTKQQVCSSSLWLHENVGVEREIKRVRHVAVSGKAVGFLSGAQKSGRKEGRAKPGCK